MIVDAQDLAEDTVFDDSVIVIGAGAAGITVACELEDLGLNVILLEAGGFSFDAEVQNLYKGFVDSTSSGALPHEPLDMYRARFFGGTTNWWGGACLPYDEVDFLTKPNVKGSGWPIQYDSLTQYYTRANNYLGIPVVDFAVPPKSKSGSRDVIQGLSHTGVFKTGYYIEKKSQVNFGLKYKDRLKKSRLIKVILNANVTSLNLKNNEISSITFKTLNSKAFQVTGKKIVLAMGGLEIPRILLASRDQNPYGVGNDYDLVGRFYSPHANLMHGILMLNSEVELDKDTELLVEDTLYKKFITLSDEYVSKGLMNCKVTLESLNAVEENQLTDHIYKLFHPDSGVGEAYEKLRGRKKYAFALNGAFDQVPNFESRVKLSNESDILGMPMITLKHAIKSQDIKAYSRFYRLLALTVGSLGLGRFCYDESLKQLYMQGGGGSHHTGTTRMASHPSQGVVDTDCKVFGVRNLYVASASVFPTASHANPTYTIVALAIRLAKHLSETMEST